MSTKVKINSQIFQDSNNTYFPKTEEEVSILIKEFYKKNFPTEIVGTNTKSFIGNKTQASNKISLSKLSGIIDYFPEELYIKVKAGTPLEDVEKALEKIESYDLGFVFVENENNDFTGVVSMADVRKSLIKNLDNFKSLRVKDIKNSEPIIINKDDSINKMLKITQSLHTNN